MQQIDRKRTLVLDSTFSPVDVVDWQRAILLVLTNKAKIIHVYDDVEIRSSYQSHQLPVILQLVGRCRRRKVVNFSRKAIFYRDHNTCAYCNEVYPDKELTLDHVIPVCQGGPKNFSNIVSACFDCNLKKGGKTPEQARMPLHYKPHEPRWNPSFFLQLKSYDPVDIWQPFIGFPLTVK